jgi:hypothetical protein
MKTVVCVGRPSGRLVALGFYTSVIVAISLTARAASGTSGPMPKLPSDDALTDVEVGMLLMNVGKGTAILSKIGDNQYVLAGGVLITLAGFSDIVFGIMQGAPPPNTVVGRAAAAVANAVNAARGGK